MSFLPGQSDPAGTAAAYFPYRTVTAATDTPTATDNYGFITYNSTSAQTVTVNYLGAGKSYSVMQEGTGQLSLVAGSSVTLVSDRISPSFKTGAQYAILTIICLDVANTVNVVGNMQ